MPTTMGNYSRRKDALVNAAVMSPYAYAVLERGGETWIATLDLENHYSSVMYDVLRTMLMLGARPQLNI